MDEEKTKLALVVDDSELNREILEDMLEENFEVLTAENGREALSIVFERLDDLSVVLLDLVMPEMGGIEVLKFMKGHGWTDKVPVIIISGESSLEVERECFKYGIFDFLHKPFEPVLVELRIKNAITIYDYRNHLEEMVTERTRRLERMNDDIVELLGNVVEARNLESGQHIRRVKAFTRKLGNVLKWDYPEYDLSTHDIEQIASASALHDVGKIMISDVILTKPGKLTQDEFEIMKTHTLLGCKILDGVPDYWEEEYRKLCYEICRYHHEKWDGRGYPDGLSGDDIPIAAQIVSVADCFDALTNERVYKKAFTADEAYEMILGGKCGAFNPKILDCFAKVRPEFEEMVKG